MLDVGSREQSHQADQEKNIEMNLAVNTAAALPLINALWKSIQLVLYTHGSLDTSPYCVDISNNVYDGRHPPRGRDKSEHSSTAESFTDDAFYSWG